MAETSVLTPTSSNGTATASPSSPPDALADAYEIEPQAAASPPTPDAGNITPPSQPAPAPVEGGTSDRGPDGRFLPKTHRHPQALIEDATDLGMSADEIASVDTNTLSMTLRYMRKGLDRERSKAATVDGAMDRNLSQEPESASHEAPPAPATPVDELDIADRDAFDPRFLAVVDKLTKKVKELEGRLGEVTGHLASEHAKTITQRCDARFKKHAKWLGDKDFADLKPGDPMLPRRQAVYKLAKEMKGGIANLEPNIDKAVEMLYGAEEPAAPSPTPPASRISQDDWDAAGLSVPTNRRGDDEPPGPAKAARSVKKLIDEHRAAQKSDDSTTYADELL